MAWNQNIVMGKPVVSLKNEVVCVDFTFSKTGIIDIHNYNRNFQLIEFPNFRLRHDNGHYIRMLDCSFFMRDVDLYPKNKSQTFEGARDITLDGEIECRKECISTIDVINFVEKKIITIEYGNETIFDAPMFVLKPHWQYVFGNRPRGIIREMTEQDESVLLAPRRIGWVLDCFNDLSFTYDIYFKMDNAHNTKPIDRNIKMTMIVNLIVERKF